jgi:glycosyltransferase involved in cell wall biosynthesis
MHICLNMIVRNERNTILRCLESVAPFIDSWVICDTGSTDMTQDIILQFMSDRGIPGELHEFEFVNFGAARNRALGLAQERIATIQGSYILLMDADMELVAGCDPDPFRDLTRQYYQLQQSGAGLTYWNTRLVGRCAPAEYIGVTHEYLDTSGDAEKLDAPWFRDHMDGGSRGDKYERDLELLKAENDRDPKNLRTLYYLAQTYKDVGKFEAAAVLYGTRAKSGGWEEEAWHAMLQSGRCWLRSGDRPYHEGGFIYSCLEAYSMRPSRAEPLLSLATYYRERGKNELAVMFAKQGLRTPYPSTDVLFIEREAYYDGFMQEIAIAGFYVPRLKEEAREACEYLAVRRHLQAAMRQQARYNLQFYAEPLDTLAHSFSPVRLTTLKRVMNPSVVLTPGGRLLTTARIINYTINPDGSYVTPDGDACIRTENSLCELDPITLQVTAASDIKPPADYPEPLYRAVQGFEDIRLFTSNDDFLHFIATVRDINAEGIATPITGVIQPCAIGFSVDYRMTDWRIIPHKDGSRHEKNWMPVNAFDGVFGGGLFVYSCDPTIVLGRFGQTIAARQSPIACENWRGSSQLINFMDGWLAVIHEVNEMPGAGERSYLHRFVFFDRSFTIERWSRQFYLQRRGIEFVAGLCWHPDKRRLVISWGANRDSEAWVGTISDDDVDAMMMYN